MQSKKATDLAFLKKTISKVSKALYRTSVDFSSFSALNRNSVTNRTFDNSECSTKKPIEIDASPKIQSLKHHHKISNGVQIYMLPKLPFGAHQSYNEEADFVSNHFDFKSESPELLKKIESLQRKFQLIERKERNSRKSQNSQKKSKSSEVYTFKTKTGFLHCPLAVKMIKIYDKNKQVLKNDEKPGQKVKKTDMSSTIIQIPKNKQNRLASRLYPARAAAETPSSLFYSSKYSLLFTKDDNHRPKTSLEDSGHN